MLKKFDSGASKHAEHIITSDELWIYAHEPRSKQKSIVRVFQDEPNPIKVDRSRTSEEVADALKMEDLNQNQKVHSKLEAILKSNKLWYGG